MLLVTQSEDGKRKISLPAIARTASDAQVVSGVGSTCSKRDHVVNRDLVACEGFPAQITGSSIAGDDLHPGDSLNNRSLPARAEPLLFVGMFAGAPSPIAPICTNPLTVRISVGLKYSSSLISLIASQILVAYCCALLWRHGRSSVPVVLSLLCASLQVVFAMVCEQSGAVINSPLFHPTLDRLRVFCGPVPRPLACRLWVGPVRLPNVFAIAVAAFGPKFAGRLRELRNRQCQSASVAPLYLKPGLWIYVGWIVWRHRWVSGANRRTSRTFVFRIADLASWAVTAGKLWVARLANLRKVTERLSFAAFLACLHGPNRTTLRAVRP